MHVSAALLRGAHLDVQALGRHGGVLEVREDGLGAGLVDDRAHRRHGVGVGHGLLGHVVVADVEPEAVRLAGAGQVRQGREAQSAEGLADVDGAVVPGHLDLVGDPLAALALVERGDLALLAVGRRVAGALVVLGVAGELGHGGGPGLVGQFRAQPDLLVAHLQVGEDLLEVLVDVDEAAAVNFELVVGDPRREVGQVALEVTLVEGREAALEGRAKARLGRVGGRLAGRFLGRHRGGHGHERGEGEKGQDAVDHGLGAPWRRRTGTLQVGDALMEPAGPRAARRQLHPPVRQEHRALVDALEAGLRARDGL
ncbi:hypothetical protein D3C72_1101860 [compost metagenome]